MKYQRRQDKAAEKIFALYITKTLKYYKKKKIQIITSFSNSFKIIRSEAELVSLTKTETDLEKVLVFSANLPSKINFVLVDLMNEEVLTHIDSSYNSVG